MQGSFPAGSATSAAPLPRTDLAGSRTRSFSLAWVPAWLALAAAFALLVRASWFLCDDAFISFRYARNLVEGHGLVFNRGEFVEGYTNFLWVLELAALWKLLGLEPPSAAPTLSLLATAGTFAVVLALAVRTHLAERKRWIAWMAAGLLATSATFAVWTTSGLETRQFTLFTVLGAALFCAWRRDRVDARGRGGLLVAGSLAFAAAELTRPEGLLLGGCAIAWFVVDASFARRLRPGDLLRAVLPFAAIVGAHYLWRHQYYGEWLPNTYHAKHVRPWYDSGRSYLACAALETGAYLWLPLALCACVHRFKRTARLDHLLAFFLIVPHALYLARIGGDHFEYRPLDFYWPLLAVPVAEGLWVLGAGLARAVRRAPDGGLATSLALGAYLALLVYSGSIQDSILFLSRRFQTRDETNRLHIPLTRENAAWLLHLPGMRGLTGWCDRLGRRNADHLVAARMQEHRLFAAGRMRVWRPYEQASRGKLPDDAVLVQGAIGVVPYFLPDVTVIDYQGLTDAAIARTEVPRANERRLLAHDRRPAPGYLQSRGVNLAVLAPAGTEEAALTLADYALELETGLWMPFDVIDRRWVESSVAAHRAPDGRAVRLARRHALSDDPAENLLRGDDLRFRGVRWLQDFEGAPGWELEGSARIDDLDDVSTVQESVYNRVGRRALSTYDLRTGDAGTGRARSPSFVPRPGEWLALFLAGGRRPEVGVRLVGADGRERARWQGLNSDHLRLVIQPLDGLAGEELQLELFDRVGGPFGHALIDHVLLVTPEAPDGEPPGQ